MSPGLKSTNPLAPICIFLDVNGAKRICGDKASVIRMTAIDFVFLVY